MNARVRQVLSDQKLRDYSKVHIFYEFSMIFDQAVALEGAFCGHNTALITLFRSTAVESFAVHVRNIVDFFYPTRLLPDDVIADDFLRGPRPRRFPKLSPILRRARTRANKEVGHLTTGRRADGAKRKVWPCAQITSEVQRILEQFLRHADPKKVHKRLYLLRDQASACRSGTQRTRLSVLIELAELKTPGNA